MSPEYAGRGDPRRSLDLLWGDVPRPRRGPKPGLDVASIVGAAIELADAGGLDGLSMRRVAERLGVGTMSLYTYVPSKAELLDLMLDSVYGEQALAIRAATTSDAEDLVGATDRRLAQRPGGGRAGRLGPLPPPPVDPADGAQPVGPRPERAPRLRCEPARHRRRRACPAGSSSRSSTSWPPTSAGPPAIAVEAVQAPAATGQTDDEWWLERVRILSEKIGDGAAFPTVTRVSEAGGFDVADEAEPYTLAFAVEDYRYGLDRVLDGVDRRITSPRA